jgi:hypothetical protein
MLRVTTLGWLVRVSYGVCIVGRGGQVHIYVVEALLIAIYLDNELKLIDIRKPFRSGTCLVR